jgi:autotransporter-associated beta strand protein
MGGHRQHCWQRDRQQLGAIGVGIGGITLQGGELLTTDDGFNTARAVDVWQGKGNDTLAAATGTTATYTGVLSDTGTLVVGDHTNAGIVVLTGNNTYGGGTIVGGVLSVAGDTNLGDVSGGLTLDAGELETRADFTTARTIALVANENIANILAAAANTTATYTGGDIRCRRRVGGRWQQQRHPSHFGTLQFLVCFLEACNILFPPGNAETADRAPLRMGSIFTPKSSIPLIGRY